MLAFLALAAIAVAAALISGCASTQITSVWRDPGVGPVQFHKVVGVAMSQDATIRRLAENLGVTFVIVRRRARHRAGGLLGDPR